jgi:hypothetical protein
MQNIVFGIIITGGLEISMIRFFFKKIDVRSYVMKNKFSPYKFDRRCCLSNATMVLFFV